MVGNPKSPYRKEKNCKQRKMEGATLLGKGRTDGRMEGRKKGRRERDQEEEEEAREKRGR